MLPNYSTFNTYQLLYNRSATFRDTTRLPIEGICTAVYTPNGSTILTRNAFHIPALQGPIYPLCNHRQRPGCGVYYYYKDVSYLIFTELILQLEYSYDNIVSYRYLGASYQGPIVYIETISTSSTAMATPLGRPSTITTEPTLQSTHIIPSDENYISSQASLPPSIDIDCLIQSSTNITPTEPSDATLH